MIRRRGAGELLLREMGIGYQLRRAFMALHRRLRAAIAPLGTTPDQYVVLWVLNAYGDLTQREVHELLYSDGNTVGEILRRLEARGWLRRRRDRNDARARRVSITPSGQALRRRVFGIARRFHRKALAPLSPVERDTFVAMLSRVFESLERSPR
jgi:DNA-binding MarR family transcriptional regulator